MRKVVIFEDNPEIQFLLKIFFKKRGFEIHAADDGTNAVAMAQQHQPDIILMDLIMPGKGGIEACQDLRQAGINIPILVLTSKAYAEDKDLAAKAGANAFLIKPFDPTTLEAAILPLLPN
jgi:DNA-binding response OmpR family regulator